MHRENKLLYFAETVRSYQRFSCHLCVESSKNTNTPHQLSQLHMTNRGIAENTNTTPNKAPNKKR